MSPVGTIMVAVAQIVYSVSTSLVPMVLCVWSLKQASKGSGERTLSIILCSVSFSKRGPRTKQSPAARQLWRWSCGFTSTWILLFQLREEKTLFQLREEKTCYRLLSQLPLWEYFFVLLFVCPVNRTPTIILCPLKKMSSKYKLLEYLCRWVISY